MRTIGILSDTHQALPDADFQARASRAFGHCDTIIHAGDLTDISLLDTFIGKDVFAVHGNMCNSPTRQKLPVSRIFTLEGYTIGLCHGAGNRLTIEERMFALFPDADCIIFGHTHSQVCHRVGTTLLINPGSFQATGRYGSQGCFAILRLDVAGLSASLHELDPL